MVDPMPMPMHIRRSDAELYHALLLTIERSGEEQLKSEGTFIREQLELHASYVNACAKIEAFADEARKSGAHSARLRFPIRPTQKTRESIENGMHRSFYRFLQDLQGAVVAQHGGAIDDCVTRVEPFLSRMANALTLESCRVLDGEGFDARGAHGVHTRTPKSCRLEHDATPRAHELWANCIARASVLIDCLRRFSREQARDRARTPQRAVRAFLKTAERTGLRKRSRSGCRRRPAGATGNREARRLAQRPGAHV